MNPLLFLISTGLADLAPEPLQCPKGSYSARMGRAQWCKEMTCSTDADCVGKGTRGIFQSESVDLRCETVPLCIQKTTRTSRQRFADRVDTKTYDVEDVLGDCDSKNRCTDGSCVTAKRCYSPLPIKVKQEEPEILEESSKKSEQETIQPEPLKTKKPPEEKGCSSVKSNIYFGWWLIIFFVCLRRAYPQT